MKLSEDLQTSRWCAKRYYAGTACVYCRRKENILTAPHRPHRSKGYDGRDYERSG